MSDAEVPSAPALATSCAQCGRAVDPNDVVVAQDRTFCRGCYEVLLEEVRRGIAALTSDIDYPRALLGAVLGGVLGIVLWWGVTALTHIAFGLVAVAIGWLVAQGAVRLAGDKRSTGLQVLAIAVSLVSFAVASYLVNMTFINAELARRASTERLAFPPASFAQFTAVVALGFDVMDLVFLGILLWQAWVIPRPPHLPERAAA
jgi:hypothetical protein